jgi:hypothetical protein
MARLRSIKPEFWTAEPIMDCSRDARLFLLGLWNFVDDAGRHLYAPRQFKASIFPGDDIAQPAIETLLEELAANRLIDIYTVDGKKYVQMLDWAVNQKIDHPTPSKLPPNPSSKGGPSAEEASPKYREDSRDLGDRSTRHKRGLAPESSRVEGSRVESNESESAARVRGILAGLSAQGRRASCERGVPRGARQGSAG